MARNYYVFSSGRLRRQDNTIFVETESARRVIPIEDIDALYVFGEVDFNTKLLTFLGQSRICLHIFNYYGHYTGSYYPREYLLSGHLLVRQVRHYDQDLLRMAIAREFVKGSAHSIGRTLAYYARRKGAPAGAAETDDPGDSPTVSDDGYILEDDPEVSTSLPGVAHASAVSSGPIQQVADQVAGLAEAIPMALTPEELMGVEGKTREVYYEAWPHILRPGDGVEFTRRVRRPPDNMVNCLISFGNGMLYATCLKEIYRTQLNPTISYLHEPAERRYSLALDLSEVFKPLIVDRVLFALLNNRVLRPEHFDRELNSCYLAEAGRKLFVQEFERKLQATLYHRRLKRHVSYQHLIRLEAYRLIRHLMDLEPYQAFRAWW